MSLRSQFLNHIAQTSSMPMAMEMVKAEGVYLTGVDGKKYFDAISGFSVSNIGHSHPVVIEAIKKQVDQYMHLMVYGEFIEQPQVSYAKLLTDYLPPSLNCVYFTNSGAEATEGAMKLAKRVTGRSKIIAFNNSYHGSTQGALSVMGSEYWRNAFRPLLPEVYHYDYGSEAALLAIDANCACVLMETVQAEAGVIAPTIAWIHALREKCIATGTLLILDEIQSGFGRTGKQWAFEHFNIIPDILLLGKALGGGMPLGAFIAEKRLMNELTYNPVLGHITTFGGHPVSCAAGKAAFEVLLNENWINEIAAKEQFILQQLHHYKIKSIRHIGLWMALELDSYETCLAITTRCIANGLITDWFLFAPHCLRFAPPLSSTYEELKAMCDIIIASMA